MGIGLASSRRGLGVAMRVAIVALVVAVGATMTGCATMSSQQARRAGDVTFEVPVTVASNVEIEASISGNDMQSPISTDLTVEDGVAYGYIDEIQPGPNRLVVITAHDTAGEQCSTAATIDVAAEEATFVDGLALDCRTEDAIIAGLGPKD